MTPAIGDSTAGCAKITHWSAKKCIFPRDEFAINNKLMQYSGWVFALIGRYVGPKGPTDGSLGIGVQVNLP